MRFVYVCIRCQRVAGIGKWPGEQAPPTGRLDESARECKCECIAGGPSGCWCQSQESTLVRAPAPPFVR